MSLLEEFIKRAPAGYDDYPNHNESADELGAKQVHYDIVDTTRWGQIVEYVYQREDEYVKVVYESGSGDSDIPYEPEFTAVRPETQTVVSYVRA